MPVIRDRAAQVELPAEERQLSEHLGLRTVVVKDGSSLVFQCPGCDGLHRVATGLLGWKWNQDSIRPSLSPAILSTWMEGKTINRCHSMVTDGKIRFLEDSTHRYSGDTVMLQPFDWDNHG